MDRRGMERRCLLGHILVERFVLHAAVGAGWAGGRLQVSGAECHLHVPGAESWPWRGATFCGGVAGGAPELEPLAGT